MERREFLQSVMATAILGPSCLAANVCDNCWVDRCFRNAKDKSYYCSSCAPISYDKSKLGANKTVISFSKGGNIWSDITPQGKVNGTM